MSNPYYGNVGLRLGQTVFISSSAFGTFAKVVKASWSQDSNKQEFIDGTGQPFGVSSIPKPPQCSFQYYVATSTTSSVAPVQYPAVSTKFDVQQTGVSSSVAFNGWLCDKVSFEELRGHEEATQVTVDATYYGF